jgi:hemoglobin
VKDIESLDDCRVLVDGFYRSVRADPMLGPVFEDVVEDWTPHLDTMARFWFTILFGRDAYHGNPLAKHVPLSIDRRHFDRWLALWSRAIDVSFGGPCADKAKARAARMADVMTERLRAR